MQNSVQEHRLGTATALLYFVVGFLIASLLVGCAQNPLTSTKTCVSYGKVKPLANPSFLSDRR